MKEENGKEERNATDKYGSAKNNMQYPSDVDKLKNGIDEINPAMPLRWNDWVVDINMSQYSRDSSTVS